MVIQNKKKKSILDKIKKYIKQKPTIDEEYGVIWIGIDNLEILKQLPDNIIDVSYADILYYTNKKWEKNGYEYSDIFENKWHWLHFHIERYVEIKRLLREYVVTYDGKDFYLDGVKLLYQPKIDYFYDTYVKGRKNIKKIEKGIKIGGSVFTHCDYRTNSEVKSLLMDPLFDEENSMFSLDEVKEKIYKHTGLEVHTPQSIENNIINIDKPDIVLDPFAGSLSTLRTAKKIGRRFIGIEYNKTEDLWSDDIVFGQDRED
jgi:hypothetical protein